MTSTWEVQKAIYTALSNNSTFMNAISNRLYDEPPTNSPYPYVTLGFMTESKNNTLDKKGYEVSATINIFTKPNREGYKPAKEILEKMNVVLNQKIFPIGSLNMVQIFYDNSDTIRDEDKRIISTRYIILVL